MEKASTFFERFQRLCREKDRSPSSVVTSAGFSSCLVTQWKNGGSPTIRTVAGLAQELGVPVSALIEDTTETVP